ncbi:MAG: DUF1574 domain-containing protein [Candidatus Obscuribacterales bacterium]|nr:DUF1574 domain-containing protein [Candidatus Obscuribacterales bacterium]
MIQDQTKAPEAKGMRAWASSVLLWTVSIVLICFFSALLIPSRCLNAADGVSGTFRVLVTKLASFLPSSEEPDIVVLGSSLVLVPAVRCDDKLAGKAPCFDRWYYDRYIPEYTRSSYLEEQIRKQDGLNLSVKNLGVASSIMSDQFGILKMMIAEKKCPKLIVLGLAPRDFLDNTQQKHLETPTRQFMREYNEDSVLPDKFSLKELQKSSERIRHHLDKVIALLRNTGIKIACNFSGHNAAVELNSASAYVGDRPNKLKDLETYKKLYNPPNFTMLSTQTKYLERFLAESKKNGIEVLVVNMPLTRENTDSLDPAALTAYIDTLKSVSARYGASFLNIGSSSKNYDLSDFEDCCHLNTKGGLKFYGDLIACLNSQAQLLAALKSSDKAAIAERKAAAAF